MYEFAETWIVPAQLILAMFGMGATLSVRDFALIFRYPVGLCIGLGLQLILVPLVALAFIEILGMSPGWALGLLLIAVVPGGATSNLFTFLARGNVPLSIAVTLTTTLVCMVTIPTILSLTASSYLPADFQMPVGQMIIDIIRCLLVPVAAGMIVYRKWPGRADQVARWSVRASLLLMLLVAIAAFGSGRMEIAEYGFGPPLAIVAFGVTLALVVPQLCRLANRFDDDTTTLSIEVVIRNTAIALLLVQFFFSGQPEQGHVLYTCLFYAGLSGLLMLPFLLLNRFDRSPVLFRARAPRPLDLEGHSGHE